MLSSLLLLMCGYCFCACDKRLLLTDQDVVQSIQSELQSLRQKIIQLENSQSRISVENTALKSELAHVNGQLATLQQTTEKASSTDVVWGRKTCPKKNGTSMIYSGIMAGKQWYEKGSGVTALCFVIPTKRSCPSGWSMEYNGVLVAGASDAFAFENICIDENREYFEGTRGHYDNGLTLHPVRARCGSLPCPPYTDNQYIPCVFCSH
ncbi:uncharacterized protein LOC111117898 [Crassostrea virginica]